MQYGAFTRAYHMYMEGYDVIKEIIPYLTKQGFPEVVASECLRMLLLLDSYRIKQYVNILNENRELLKRLADHDDK